MKILSSLGDCSLESVEHRVAEEVDIGTGVDIVDVGHGEGPVADSRVPVDYTSLRSSHTKVEFEFLSCVSLNPHID